MIILSKKEVYGVIYVIENKINGKKYVGQTTQGIKRRLMGHRSEANRGSSNIVHRAIRKYGYCNFKTYQVDTAKSHRELNEKESLWINNLNSLTPYGYNMNKGGSLSTHTGADHHGARKVVNLSTGEKFDTIKMACDKYGVSGIHKALNSEGATSGGFSWAYYEDYVRGAFTVSEPRSKRFVKIIDIDTKKVYKSVGEAARECKTSSSGVVSCCAGYKKSANGHRLMYLEEYNSGTNRDFSRKTNAVKVINLDTEEIFESLESAILKFNISSKGNLVSVCQGKRNKVGGYRWAYYEDYKKGNIFHNQDKVKTKVINIDTLEVFDSIADAAKYCGVARSGVTNVCRNSQKTAGGYRWQYYEDYLKENT